MGQYYAAILERNGKRSIYEPRINNEFQGFKICEHSWFKNDFMSAVAKKILNKPTRIIWCGDYAEDEELQTFISDLTVSQVHEVSKGITSKAIDNKILSNKFLVNHDKKIYIDLNRYSYIAEEFNEKGTWYEGWVLNPISLLTALGNDRGGGDYHKGDSTTCFDAVGTWAYDLISLETKAPVGYKEEKHVIFTERVKDDNRALIDVYGLNCNYEVICLS